MNLQSRLGLALACLSLVFSIGFFLLNPEPKLGEIDTPAAPSVVTEVMPESSGEAYRVHVRGTAGQKTEVRIRYLDGSDGVLILHKDGSVNVERRHFVDGSVRKEAYFDTDGILRSGFEKRIDKSLLWKTVVSDDDKIVTHSFWPDGKLFQQRTFDLTNGHSHRTFFRADGIRWQDDATNQFGVLVEQRLYDQAGRLRIHYSVTKEGAGKNPFFKVVHFDENGVIDFDQLFGYSADVYFDPADGESNPNPVVLKNVGHYTDGQLVKRTFTSASGRIYQIEEYFGDSLRRSYVQMRGNITQIEVESSSGRTTRFDFEGKFGVAAPLDKRFMVPLPDGSVPLTAFEKSEREYLDAQ